MIRAKGNITGTISAKQHLKGNLNNGVEYRYPVLENLNIKPSGVEQRFNHPNSYGYDEVVVEAVESDTLDVVPTEEKQQITGLYGIVNVEPIPEEYVVAEVEENTLVLSRVDVEGGALIL